MQIEAMITGWSSKQKELHQAYADFGKSIIAPGYSGRYDQAQFAQEAWRQLARETDFWRLPIPSTLGGMDGSWWDFTAALEGLASTAEDIGFLLSCIAQAGVLRGLLSQGNHPQQERYIPWILEGALTATAIAEPQSGTDVPNVKTVAAQTPEGYHLNGDKWHIAHGSSAKLTLVVGRSAETEGLTCFWVENDTPGVEATPHKGLGGIRTLPIASLSFTDVPITEVALFGEAGKGLPALGSAVSLARPYYGLLAAQLLENALPQVMEFLRTRQSFAQPILKHQQVQQKLTDVQLAISQARWTAYGALHTLLEGDPQAIMLGSVAKLAGTQGLITGSQTLLSLLSSHGYTQQHPIFRLVQDAMGMMSVGGTEETHRINIFNQMQRLAR